METDFIARSDNVAQGLALLRQAAPDVMKAFGAIGMAATASRAIDAKTKELIGIAVHCDGCVAYHTRAGPKHGATGQEVAENVVLALYMGGGPAAVYGADALRAYDQMADGADS